MEDIKVNSEVSETKDLKSIVEQWEDWKKLAALELFKPEE